jgi:hypothetical protein
MNDSPENTTETVPDDASATAGTPAPQPAERSRGQVDVNDSKVVACYANFCRVTGTPEELIVDFGLNKNMQPAAHEPVEIAQRIIFNFFTAKRLAAALVMAVQRHEAAFGALETDVQKRVLPPSRKS